MKTKAEWRLEGNDAKEAADAIMKKAESEDRDMTDAERQDVDKYLANSETCEAEIRKIEADDLRKQRLAKITEEMSRPSLVVRANPTGRIEHAGELEPWERHLSSGSLVGFKGANAKRNAYLCGQWLLGKIAGPESDVGRRAMKMCRDYGIIGSEDRALSTNVNTYGGFLVPTPMEAAIIENRETYGVFRQNCRISQMSADTQSVPRYLSGSTASWGTEAGALSDSTPTFDSVSLVARKLYSLVKISSEIQEDAVISVSDWLARDMGMQFAYQEDLAGFIGDGSATYGGIQGVFIKLYTASPAIGAIDAASGHDSLDEVTTDDLATLVGILPQYARPNAKWFCSGVGDAVIFGALQMAAGGNTIADLGSGPIRTYWGFPVVISQVLPSSLTATAYNNLVMVALGDLTMSSTLGDRRGIRLEILTELYAGNDQIGIKATERLDIVNHDVGNSTTVGPVVGLVGQT